jgi:hypothetical protein
LFVRSLGGGGGGGSRDSCGDKSGGARHENARVIAFLLAVARAEYRYVSAVVARLFSAAHAFVKFAN